MRVSGGSSQLNAWIDFNRDGSWGGPGEHIADGRSVVAGDNTITFDVPSWAADGQTFARFRVSSAGDLGPNGPAQNGEVEDYAVTIKPPKAACGCFSGPKNVTTNLDVARSVHAADMDGDGDMDVLSASGTVSPETGIIAWYENNGNQGFTRHTITDSAADDAREVFAVDLDGDDDIDVLSAGTHGGIDWYENDGNQTFTPHAITSFGGAYSVYAADVDGDGDLDVLSAHSYSNYFNRIDWYENDGNQNFSLHNIATGVQGARSVHAADVDRDGDMDVLSASWFNDAIIWYENDGAQHFTPHVITTAADGARDVYTADVDEDGDIDVLSASWGDGTIAWYENDRGQNFTAQAISTTADFAQSVYAADVDGDSDVDVLSTSGLDNSDDEVAWYENDGSENFTAHTITTNAFGALGLYAADVDGDGDLDVLSANAGQDTIAWYENRRAKAVGAQADLVGPPVVPLPPPPVPIVEFAKIQPSRARSESSSGVSGFLSATGGLTLPARQLGCAASAAPAARHMARLVSADVVSLDAFFVDL